MLRLFLLLLLLTGCRQTRPAGQQFQLRVAQDRAGQPARLEVTSRPGGAFLPAELDRWTTTLRLHVEGQDTPVAGRLRMEDDALVYESAFALVGGTTYRAVFDPATTGSSAKPLTKTFTVPLPPPTAPARVTAVHPLHATLPCNVLRFYLWFSRPMREGQGHRHFAIVDDRGRPVPEPFKEVELWNADSTRLTLYLHPGRIKRGVGLNVELGPILEPKRRYTLVVQRALQDATGQPMTKEFRHSFTTTDADHTQPDMKKWKIIGTPLLVRFDEPLDTQLALRMIRIVESDGTKVPGEISVAHDGLQWQFWSPKSWSTGKKYFLVADPDLEDRAGNSLGRAFEEKSASSSRSRSVTTRREFTIP